MVVYAFFWGKTVVFSPISLAQSGLGSKIQGKGTPADIITTY
jgi:hypothetical protein